jgi:hypothetical protein
LILHQRIVVSPHLKNVTDLPFSRFYGTKYNSHHLLIAVIPGLQFAMIGYQMKVTRIAKTGKEALTYALSPQAAIVPSSR